VAHSVRAVLDRLEYLIGRPIAVVPDQERLRPVERVQLVADITRLRTATRWRPRIALDETLRDLVAAYGLVRREPAR
jgi:nucleoside-diphosphate-sugar epimerase